MTARKTPSLGVWVAYYEDWSSVVLFEKEVEALRYAVENKMAVMHAAYGKPLRDQT